MTQAIEQYSLDDRVVAIEAGNVAGNANGAVWVSCDETVLLATVTIDTDVAIPTGAPLSLTVHYQEKQYATGRIPASFTKRQGRRTDKETLVARATDRCIRPLLPESLRHPIDLIIEVMSLNPSVPPESLAITAASSALMVSDLPFAGPVASASLQRDAQGQWSPRQGNAHYQPGTIVVGISDEGLLMVEGRFPLIDEDELLSLISETQTSLQPALDAQRRLGDACSHAAAEAPPTPLSLSSESSDELAARYQQEILADPSFMAQKLARNSLQEAFDERLSQEHEGADPGAQSRQAFAAWETAQLVAHLQQTSQRLDGRKVEELRPVSIELDRLPRTHGNAIFSRGETQVAAIVTLGSSDEELLTETLTGMTRKHFYVQYNFPSYAAGRQGRFGVWGRREIGHGHLVERALQAVIPGRKEFPYTISVIAEVLSANGSSSMASVCSASLALLSAGVPLQEPIAGIAVGLFPGDEPTLLLDPLCQEDGLGEMDCKVCGGREGITAIQMDLKRPGISVELFQQTLALARQGRHQLLDEMATHISEPRELSPHAARQANLEISTGCAKDLLGHGGKKLRKLKEKSGAKIVVHTSGQIQVSAPHQKSLTLLKELLETYEEEYRKSQHSPEDKPKEAKDKPKSAAEHDPPLQVGKIYKGTVTHIKHYGAFVEIQPGAVGLLHVSELTNDDEVQHISHYVSQNQDVDVKLIQVDKKGRIGLSLRQVEADAEA